VTEPEKQKDESSKELDRIVFFSDAVFAIAMTLLVLDIRTPEIPSSLVTEELPGRLLALWPKILSYVVSFLVILSYWMAHHSIFSSIKSYDRGLIWMNSLYLMCVAFLPFPTSLLGEYGDQQLVVAIYAGILAVTRLLLTAVWWYATNGHRLVDPDLDLYTMRG
jgi:TMEM175 potassium channel family protein